MVQGTGSNVGKSTLVAGLCRAFARRGLAVRPFKPQNMSNNAAVTPDGGEIGRAQAVQARAAGIPASIHMNPVLLKPETDTGAQVIVQGRPCGHTQGPRLRLRKAELSRTSLRASRICQSGRPRPRRRRRQPGRDQPAAGDIANMGFAEAADVPVVLVGDIDRGGVIASLVGTHVVLEPSERARIRAFAINRFRGDVSLFESGVRAVTERTGWPCVGIVPWLPAAACLPAEDALDLQRPQGARGARMKIAVPVIARIANFDDLDPLGQEPDVELVFVSPGEPMPGDAGLIILPGSKSTLGDLAFLRRQGWDVDILAHRRRGGRVLGLCGGYQMLGRTIADPDGIEGPRGSAEGLGLLDIATTLSGDKVVAPAGGTHLASGSAVAGYEIHLGRTSGPDCARPLLALRDGRMDGAASPDGLVEGCYVHGLFASDAFRRAYLAGFGTSSRLAYETGIEAALDELADHVATHLDLDRMLAIARER
jgi:adenosylcobyric acid synthase